MFKRKMAVEESWATETLNNVEEEEEGMGEVGGQDGEEVTNGNGGAMDLETSEARAGEGNGVVEVDENDTAE